MQGNASAYQVYPVSGINGRERAELSREWRHGFEQEGAQGRGGGDGRENSICAWKLFNPSSKGINLTFLEGMHQFIMYIL